MHAGERGGIGHVVSIAGSRAALILYAGQPQTERISVGRLVVINTQQTRVIAVISHVAASVTDENSLTGVMRAEADLIGEISQLDDTPERFERGITAYPIVGDPVDAIDSDDLHTIHHTGATAAVEIGRLQQDRALSAYLNVDEMLSKHFAVLGSTGVGKSCGVALLLQKVMAARSDVRVLLFDPHNEYASCFGDQALVLRPDNVELPFWLFSFEEIVDVIFRARPGVDEEVEILSEVIPLARALYDADRAAPQARLLKSGSRQRPALHTVDTPVPYRVSDLLAILNERMGKLENRALVSTYNRLAARIKAVVGDPRYGFMFGELTVTDNMADVLGHIFRIPANDKRISIMQLAGFPVEVVDSVVSVLARMAFDFGLWSDGAFPLLLVCEEAHRHLPADKGLGFGPTRRAFSRIAKEGRKYGVFLSVVTQRPAELDATILSQCSSLFAMRLANDRDQAIVKAAVSDAGSGLIGFLPSLGTSEAIAFGEAVPLPMRFRFKTLPQAMRPRSETIRDRQLVAEDAKRVDFVKTVVDRWRGKPLADWALPDATDSDDIETAPPTLTQTPELSQYRAPAPAARIAPLVGARHGPAVVETVHGPDDFGDTKRRPFGRATPAPIAVDGAVRQRYAADAPVGADWVTVRKRLQQQPDG